MYRRMSDCHLEVYSVCQEGVLLLKNMTVEFDDGERGQLEGPLRDPCTTKEIIHAECHIKLLKTLGDIII